MECEAQHAGQSQSSPHTKLVSLIFWYDSTWGSLGLKFKITVPPPPPQTQYCKNYLAFGLIVLFFSVTLLLTLRFLYFQTGTLQTECKRYVYNVNNNGASFCC